jgi:alkylhydroperoxidase family enzyme
MGLRHIQAVWANPLRRRSRYLGLLLLITPLLAGKQVVGADNDGPPMSPRRVPLLRPDIDDRTAWRKLPRVEKGANEALPAWARVLVPTLPHTTAAMLELDHRHRAGGALAPKLRAMVRWTAAHTLGCTYAEAYAEADLRRGGGTAEELRALRRGGVGLPDAERAAIAFARRLTTDPGDVTDEEVAVLIARHGEKQVVAMVLLLAYAHFQDRLLVALDLPPEPDGPLAPLDVRFAPIPLGSRLAMPRPQRVRVQDRRPVAAPEHNVRGPDWDALNQGIEQQHARRPRIKLPSNEGNAVYWGAVCRRYQPELASAWSLCQRTFGAEANLDPVFETSVFWIVSQAQKSFY